MCLSVSPERLPLDFWGLIGVLLIGIIFLLVYPQNSYAQILTPAGKDPRRYSCWIAVYLAVPLFLLVPARIFTLPLWVLSISYWIGLAWLVFSLAIFPILWYRNFKRLEQEREEEQK